MATEKLYPTDHTDGTAQWTNPAYAYNKDGITSGALLDKKFAYDDITGSLILHSWEAKTEQYTALYIKAQWNTNSDYTTQDDEWGMDVSVDGGNTWNYTLLAQSAENRKFAKPLAPNASVEIPNTTDMADVQVRANLEKVKLADGDDINLWEVWSEGTVAEGVTVTPDPATAVTVSVAPTVVKGSITITPDAATAVAQSTDPTVIRGSITITPDAAYTVAASVDPTVIKGSITITPTEATAVAASADPTVIKGSITLSPEVAYAIAASVDPTVIRGAITITPSAASAIAVSVDPTVAFGAITYTFDIQSSYLTSAAGAFDWYPGDDSNTFEVEQ